MAQRTSEEIIKLVEKAEQRLTGLRSRMDEDYSKFWRLDKYKGEDALDGYRVFTSNSPKTFAHEIITTLAGSGITITVPQSDAQKEQREVNSESERFFIGMLKMIDDNLDSMLLPLLQAALSWQICCRGWYAGVAVMTKKPDPVDAEGNPVLDEQGQPVVGKTFPYVMPFDPRNVTWARGGDGLAWICNKSPKTREDIESEFNIVLPVTAELPLPGLNDDEKGVDVYDFWDGQHNTIVLEGGIMLKPKDGEEPVPHGSPRTPGFIGYTGPISVVSDDSGPDAMQQVGESIWSMDRHVYDEINFVQSVLSELVERSISPSYTFTSRDGQKSLEENPYQAQQQVGLAEGEKIEILNPTEAAKETGVYLASLNQEMERGSLPDLSFGQLRNPISGFAINSLKKGTDSKLHFPLIALQQAYSQICALLRDQYATNQFDPVSVSGRDRLPFKTYFSQVIDPQVVSLAGTIEVEIWPVLPEDDAAKVALIQQFREPVNGEPLVTVRHAREMAGIQDPDLMGHGVAQELAKRSSPMAFAFSMMESSAQEGEEEYANIWLSELRIQMIQKLLELRQLELAAAGFGVPQGGLGGLSSLLPSGGGTNGQSSGGRGLPPNVSPPQEQGINARPTQQSGPNVPQGTPRPGARVTEEESNENRLNNLNLVGPRG